MDRTGLLTDRYELTMLDSFVRDGSAGRPAVFEAFARRLPEGRRYGMLAGLGRLLAAVEDFTFDADEITWLTEQGVIGEQTASYLADFRFRGDIDGYREGDLYFPGSPIFTVTGTLGEGVVLETLVLSILNHDTAIASAAARMVDAARTTTGQGRPIIEMGGRRTHEQAAVATARAAYLAGFGSTSNLLAGKQYGVPTAGTAAHAFTLAHATEADAFRSQVEALGVGTTLLVDTYDIPEGIRTAVEVAGPGLGAIRLDSGDLAEEAHKARQLLDSLGATQTRIVATSDLDEFVITALADAPIDGYGVGTRVATGSGHPTASMVYKLVAIADSEGEPLRPVAKKSKDKASVGGHKTPFREYDAQGLLRAEWFLREDSPPPGRGERPVQVPLVRDGEVVHRPGLDEIRDFAAAALATLPTEARGVAAGAPYLVTTDLSTTEHPQVEEVAQRPSRDPSTGKDHTMSKRALIVVDVQNDFVEGGSLGVAGGHEVARRISDHLAANAGDYTLIAASRDWHIGGETNGGHFHEPGTDPDFVTTWPVHCVQGEAGSEYAPELVTDAVTHHVVKGMGEPAYSAFEGVTEAGERLADLLRAAGVTEVDVTGIATDHCVRATALDAVKEGFAATLLRDMHAGVAPESSAAALDEMAAAGVAVPA